MMFKMSLHTANYVFPMKIDLPTDWDPSTTIYIGNPNNKPKPCIVIEVEGSSAIIQTLQYVQTCSVNTVLKKGEGTVEMVKASLKWLMQTYPEAKRIDFSDMSYIPLSKSYNMPLPEYYALVHGQTWYQQHFGAIPSKKTKTVLQSYTTLRMMKVKDTPLVKYLPPSQHDKHVYEVIGPLLKRIKSHNDAHDFLRMNLRLRPLTSTSWYIPRQTALAYDIEVSHANNTQQGGGIMAKMRRKLVYYYPYYHAKN